MIEWDDIGWPAALAFAVLCLSVGAYRIAELYAPQRCVCQEETKQ